MEGVDIVCFSNDWDGDPLGKKHIMLRLARHNRILWVNSIGNRAPTASARDFKRAIRKARSFAAGCRLVSENIYLLPPLAIPFFKSRFARRINRWLLRQSVTNTCRKLGFRDPLTWSFLPSSADVVRTVGSRFVIYQCVDEYSEFSGTDKQAILEMERRLIETADLVIVSSGRLLENKRKYNPNTFLVTHGVDFKHFRRACHSLVRVPGDLAQIRRPVIGFHGLIADWVDLSLIRFLARARPEWAVVLIGKVDTDVSAVDGLANVRLLGRKEYEELPAYCKGFDVAILPFVVNELTIAANPLKLREYLAAGLPVVTTAIPEAQRLDGHVRVAWNPAQFLEHIDRLLAEGKTGPQRSISDSMADESWDAKVEEISLLFESIKTSQEFTRKHAS
ncbi:MAG: glycosyltransferase [Acidobacteria bacterium]|nr:glycosyltransferase [Acidobacteriota bacterium]